MVSRNATAYVWLFYWHVLWVESVSRRGKCAWRGRILWCHTAPENPQLVDGQSKSALARNHKLEENSARGKWIDKQHSLLEITFACIGKLEIDLIRGQLPTSYGAHPFHNLILRCGFFVTLFPSGVLIWHSKDRNTRCNHGDNWVNTHTAWLIKRLVPLICSFVLQYDQFPAEYTCVYATQVQCDPRSRLGQGRFTTQSRKEWSPGARWTIWCPNFLYHYHNCC